MTAAGGKYAALVALLDDDRTFDVVSGAIQDARDKAPRVRDDHGAPIDRDSGEVLEDVIKTLRDAD